MTRRALTEQVSLVNNECAYNQECTVPGGVTLGPVKGMKKERSRCEAVATSPTPRRHYYLRLDGFA